jgi:hypothetical protein
MLYFIILKLICTLLYVYSIPDNKMTIINEDDINEANANADAVNANAANANAANANVNNSNKSVNNKAVDKEVPMYICLRLDGNTYMLDSVYKGKSLVDIKRMCVDAYNKIKHTDVDLEDTLLRNNQSETIYYNENLHLRFVSNKSVYMSVVLLNEPEVVPTVKFKLRECCKIM